MVRRTEKFRGSRTHGRGKKSGRGAGKRGGKGNAGLLKHKYISIIKYDPDHFGRHGFKRPQKIKKDEKAINVGHLEERIDLMVEEKTAKMAKDAIEIDLTSMGIDKLLGGGSVTKTMKITVAKASQKAIEKIEEAGGRVELAEAEVETVVEAEDEQ